MPDSVRIVFLQQDGVTVEADGHVAETVRDLALRVGVKGMLGECGGNCACATCHVQIAEEWVARIGLVEPDSVEDATLDFCTNRARTSRLACQLPIRPELDGLTVAVGNAE